MSDGPNWAPLPRTDQASVALESPHQHRQPAIPSGHYIKPTNFSSTPPTAHPYARATIRDVQESRSLLDEAAGNDSTLPLPSAPIATSTPTSIAQPERPRTSIGYSHEVDSTPHRPATWIPYTLRKSYLFAIAAIALSLSIALIVLCWYSSRNQGLGRDDGSAKLLMGWRYTPTVIAVLFVQTLVLLFEDVQRTEPFAQLSRVHPAETLSNQREAALQLVSKVWWKTFFIGLNKKKNGGRTNTVLSISALTTGLGLLLFSTLSSSLLVSEQVIIVRPVDLRRFALDSNGSLPLNARRDTYFHTISGVDYNASATVWVTDEFVIFPFEVPDLESENESISEGLWEAETTVFQAEGSCIPMSIETLGTTNLSFTYEWDNRTFTKYSLKPDNVSYTTNDTNRAEQPMVSLTADNGCRIQIIDPPRVPRSIADGGVLWTNMSTSHISWKQFSQDQGGKPWVPYFGWSPMLDAPLVEFSDECLGQNLLFVSEQWKTLVDDATTPPVLFGPEFRARAELCNMTYHQAAMLVTATKTQGSTRATFDKDQFKARREPLKDDTLDLEYADHLAFAGIKPNDKDMSRAFGGYKIAAGMSEALASPSQSNNTVMINDPDLVNKANRLRGRFFGELVYSSLTNRENPSIESTAGHSTTIEQRIVVVVGVAAAIAALLFCVTCYLLFMLWKASPKHRALKLRTDPTTVAGVIDYLHHEGSAILDATLAADTRKSTAIDTKSANVSSVWSKRHWNPSRLKQGTLITTNEVNLESRMTGSTSSFTGSAGDESNRDWRPKMLLSRTLLTFLLVLVATTTALIVLRMISINGQLYRTAFVYQMGVGRFNAQISPISLTATLLAVTLALCWDSIDKSLRVLQPYLSMAKGSTDVRKGACLSYQSSHWVWASYKAAFNKHWLLCLVTFGTTLLQILIVAMAAVFERQPSTYMQTVLIDRPLAARRAPLVYQHEAGRADADYLKSLMRTITGDWMYTALDELTMGTAAPPWSQDEWSFTPIDLNELPPLHFHQNTGRKAINAVSSELLSSASNATITTTAIRAELSCTTLDLSDITLLSTNETNVLGEEVGRIVRDRSKPDNTDGYVLSRFLLDGTNFKTTLLNTPARVMCCANQTDRSHDSAVAYWSYQDSDLWWSSKTFLNSDWDGFGPPKWPGNLMLKWVVGRAESADMVIYANGSPSNYTLMNYPTMPETQIMSCEPSFESAEATVTVARESGQVLDYEILEEPQRILEPWDTVFDYSGLGPYAESYTKDSNYSVELSYGVYFLTQLIQAASIERNSDPIFFENLQDERYNMRDKALGINMDFMSYSNYIQVGRDSRALLDSDTMWNVSRRTFQTFYQHYASRTRWIDGTLVAYEEPESNGNFQMPVTMTERIEVLALSETATWLCVAILIIMIIIIVTLIISLKFIYPHALLRRNVKCLADVIAMVKNSDNFLEQIARQGPEQLAKSGVHTRLGWFRDTKGDPKWGIEVVDGAVEWIGGHGMVLLREKGSTLTWGTQRSGAGAYGEALMAREDEISRVVR
ncbi:hypothetical protein NX059_003090 [Plenodomus lindquistii]|nr:hypothetical protein NX059_003090 [Plenodomus lindquistii]